MEEGHLLLGCWNANFRMRFEWRWVFGREGPIKFISRLISNTSQVNKQYVSQGFTHETGTLYIWHVWQLIAIIMDAAMPLYYSPLFISTMSSRCASCSFDIFLFLWTSVIRMFITECSSWAVNLYNIGAAEKFLGNVSVECKNIGTGIGIFC